MSQSQPFRLDQNWKLNVNYSWTAVDQIFHQIEEGQTALVIFSVRHILNRFRGEYQKKVNMVSCQFFAKVAWFWDVETAKKAIEALPKKFRKRGEEIFFQRGDSVVIVGNEIFAFRIEKEKMFEALKK